MRIFIVLLLFGAILIALYHLFGDEIEDKKKQIWKALK